MRRHHRRQTHAQPAVGRGIFFQNIFRIALVDWNRNMRIRRNEPMSGKMLTAVRHACLQQSVIDIFCEHRDNTWVAKNINHGLLQAGMANCGKHFPGHGFVAADSHIAIPVDERDPKDILKEDAAPYGWLGMSLSAVMPAHVIYPFFDSQPAGFSRKWLSLLRDELGFEGVIFSDDLSMEGASVAGNVVQGAHAALKAGCDMVLVCNSPDKADQLLAGLDPTVAIDAKRSAARIAALVPASPAKTWDELQADPVYKAAHKLVQSLV